MTDDSHEILNPRGPSRWVILCDHASNSVPADLGGCLGLPAEDMARHIAWDPGTAGVCAHLSRLLDAPAVMSRFSRLVIDPNRGEDDPTLLMKLYDGTIIPGNRDADATEKARRLERYYRPYDRAIARTVADRPGAVLCSVHSFTPQLRGRPLRPWQIGVLFNRDRRLTDPLIARLQAEGDLCVGVNEPYNGYYPGDTMDRHALSNGLLHVLIEIRNDLISDEGGQLAWAERLAPLLQTALEDAEHG